ncbi:hypothetical protein ACLK1T_19040 [Escherichia coli]
MVPGDHEYFRGGGYSSRFLTEGGVPFTMTRVNIIKGLGPVLQIAEGWSVELPKDVHDILNKRTDSTWPTTWFAPRLTGKGPFTDVYSVMANWGANHGVLTIGHVGADLSLSPPCCVSRYVCTTLKRPKCIVLLPGLRTAWILKARITALARTTVRCTSVNTLLPDVMPGRSGYRA